MKIEIYLTPEGHNTAYEQFKRKRELEDSKYLHKQMMRAVKVKQEGFREGYILGCIQRVLGC